MNKKEIFRKIGGIISELTEQYQYLSENTEEINDLELELFIANSNFLTDHIEILRKLNIASAIVKHEASTALPPLQESVRFTVKGESILEQNLLPKSIEIGNNFEPDVDLHTALENTDVKPEESAIASADIQDESQVNNETVPTKQADISRNNTFENAATLEVPEVVQELKSFRETVMEDAPEIKQPWVQDNYKDAETTDVSENNTFEQAATIEAPESVRNLNAFQQQAVEEKVQTSPIEHTSNLPANPTPIPTVHDLISAQRKPLAEPVAFNKKPITDLKSGISLNDKLLFIKDLFNGYSLAYSEAIELLNRFDAFDAADRFLQSNYAQKNNWAAKQSTADKFYEIFERRFSK